MERQLRLRLTPCWSVTVISEYYESHLRELFIFLARHCDRIVSIKRVDPQFQYNSCFKLMSRTGATKFMMEGR